MIYKLKTMFENINNKLNNRKKIIIILGVIFLAFLLLNIFTPLLGDDFLYMFYNENRIKSISEILKSQYGHYFGWGGRCIVHFIAQMFLMFDKSIFNIANSIVFILLIVLIWIYASINKKLNISTLIFILLLIWNFIPVFGQTTLWLTGACNYLWGTVLILLFLLPFRLSLIKEVNMKWYQIIPFSIFGILAGWTNENTSAAMLFMIGLILIKCFKDKKLKLWHITSFITSIIGFVFMILAPGNFARASDFETVGNKFIVIIKRIFVYTIESKENLLLLIVILAILFIINYITNKDKKNIMITTCIFLLGSLAGIYSMVASPIFPERAYFGLTVFMIIAISYNFNNLTIFDNKNFKTVKIFVYIVLFLSFILDYSYLLYNVKQINSIYKEREYLVIEAKQNGIYDIEFETYETFVKRSPLYGMMDVGSNKEDNISLARYYNINSVIGK